MDIAEDDKAHLKAVFNSFPPGRLAPYLAECQRNPFAALRLYAWNANASGAMYETLGHFEVILRNRIDEALVSRHAFKRRPGDWLDDAHGEFSEKASEAIVVAKARAKVGLDAWSPPRGRVIAELNFGFWRRVLDTRYERIHGSAIMRLFPTLKRNTNDDMENLRQLVEPLYALRNRIAHLEPVWPVNLGARRNDAIAVIRLVNDDAAQGTAVLCRLDSILAERSTMYASLTTIGEETP